MSTKPSGVPTWSTDVNYPAGAESYSGTPTKVAPTGTRRQRGHEPKSKPPAQVENYDRNLIGQWCQYLNDGAFTGVSNFADDVTFDGDNTYFNSQAVFNANVQFNDVLTSNNDGGLVTFDTGIIAPNVYFTSNVQRIHATSNWFNGGTHTHSATQVILAASATTIYMPLRVDAGDVITGYRVRVRKNTNGSATIAAVVVNLTDSGTAVSAGGAVSTNANAPGLFSLGGGPGSISIPVVTGVAYAIEFTPSGSVTPTADRVYHVDLYVTRPNP